MRVRCSFRTYLPVEAQARCGGLFYCSGIQCPRTSCVLGAPQAIFLVRRVEAGITRLVVFLVIVKVVVAKFVVMLMVSLPVSRDHNRCCASHCLCIQHVPQDW